MMIHMCIFLLLFMVVGAPLLPSLSLSHSHPAHISLMK